MPVQRDLWSKTFTEKDPPSWPCPTCGVGSLTAVAGTFQIEETSESKDAHSHEAWEPEWIVERFVGMLRCSRSQCADVIAVAGRTESEEYYRNSLDPEEPYDHGVETRLRPRYLSPSPALFPMPASTPDSVRDEIVAGFGLFWIDYGACANKLRSALEALMDHFKIPRSVRNKKTGKRSRLDLHQRIEKLRARFPDVVDHLLAAKWIGNAGVHSGSVTRSDVFDAMDLIENALEELIAKKSTGLKKIAKAITKRKRPRGK